MIDASKTNNTKAFKDDNHANNKITLNDKTYNKLCSQSYEQLKQYEQQWWHARQRFVKLKEKQVFWFGDNSMVTWLLWQLVSYVIVAMVLMLLGRLLETPLSLGHYMTVFGVQTAVFILALLFKGQLSNRMQRRIDNADTLSQQALEAMALVAANSIFPYVHTHAPISLQTIHTHYEAQLKLATLQRLLQKEIEAGRLLLNQHQIEAQVLPPEFIDDELVPYASEMVYKSLVAHS